MNGVVKESLFYDWSYNGVFQRKWEVVMNNTFVNDIGVND